VLELGCGCAART